MGGEENNCRQEHQEHIKKSDFNKYKQDLIDKLKEIIEVVFNDFQVESKGRKNRAKEKIIENFKNYLNALLSGEKIQSSKNIKKKENIKPFSSYDIEDEYKKLTDEIKNESRNEKYNDKEGEPENKNVSFFCRNIGIISREAYNQSNLILKDKLEIFKKEEKIKLKCEKDLIRKNFSCWIKLNEENESDFYKKYLNNYDNLFKNKDLKYNEEEKKYLIEIYKKLTILYIHCMLSFPIINIKFDLDESNKTDFVPNEMIDWTNKGTNRKVNFIFLPRLLSNGINLSNGKYYVFTYKVGEKNETFFFENLNLDSLLTNEEFNIEKSVLKPDIRDNKVFVTTDYNFDDNSNLRYLFKFKDINGKNIPNEDQKEINNCKIPDGFIFEECVLLYKNTDIGKGFKEEKINK